MKYFFLTYYLILPSLCYCLSSIYPLSVSFGDDSTQTFDSGKLIEFEIDNSSSPKEVQIIISIDDTSANSSNSCYQLLLSKTQIPLSSFQDKAWINFYYYQLDSSSSQKQFIDVDGLASCSKTLSAWIYQNPLDFSNQKIYAYLIGPYKFGTSQVNVTPQQLTYDAHYQILNSFSCLNNCSSKGVCTKDGYCRCNQGYISRDCSIEATLWNISEYAEGNFYLNQGQKKYFVIDFKNQQNKNSTDVLFQFETTNDSAFLFYSYEYPGVFDFQIPDYDYWQYNLKNQGFQMFSLNNQVTSIQLLKEQIQKFIYEEASFILMFVSNSPSVQLTYKIGSQSDENSVGQGLAILFAILGILVILLLIYSFFVCTRKLRSSLGNVSNRSRNQLNQRQQQSQLQVIEGQGNNNNINNNNENRQNTLSLIQIDKYMPAKQLDQQLKDAYNIESCAVCLEDFANCKEKVRLTICQHLFHSDCLISWMEKQQNCPFCRHKLTLEQLENYNKNPLDNKVFSEPMKVLIKSKN